MMAERSLFSKIRLKPETDWDFATADNQDVRTFLSSNGFFVKKTYGDAQRANPYAAMDINSKLIFKHKDYPIDCVIKHDMDVHHRIFDTITPEFYVKHLWKSGPHAPSRESIREIISQMALISQN